MYDKNAFCKGALCRVTDRKYISIVSKKEMCGKCCVELDNKKYCTFDELLTDNHPLILKKFKELIGAKDLNIVLDREITKA